MNVKVGKIIWITFVLLVVIQNICFADVVWQDPKTGELIRGSRTIEMIKEDRKKALIEMFYEWFLEKGGLWISLGIVITIVIAISINVLNKTSENENTYFSAQEKNEINKTNSDNENES